MNIVEQTIVFTMSRMLRWCKERPDNRSVVMSAVDEVPRIIRLIESEHIRTIDELIAMQAQGCIDIGRFIDGVVAMANDHEWQRQAWLTSHPIDPR